MGFTGFEPSEKLAVIRNLIAERTKRSLFARWLIDADSLDVAALMGCPEATVVTIVENYYVLCGKGAGAALALSSIEKSRSKQLSGTGHAGSDLEAYVRYRVRLEHRTGRQMSDSDISRACFVTSALAERHVSEDNATTSRSSARHEQVAEFNFICELPHRETNPASARSQPLPVSPEMHSLNLFQKRAESGVSHETTYIES